MSEDDFSRIAAQLLASRPVEARPRGVDRDQGIAIVAHAIAERARRRFRVRVLSVTGLVAAAACVAVFAGRWGGASHALAAGTCASAEPGCLVSSRTGLVEGHAFEPGQSIVAGRGRSTVVEFGPITRLSLDEFSELEYRQGDTTRRFSLLRGAVHLRVDKLKSGQRFLVETPDAEVEVRGTVFSVALAQPGDACASPRTRVLVDEGVVTVRFHGAISTVRAGESWPVGCAEAALPAAPSVSSTPSVSPTPSAALSPEAHSDRPHSPSAGAPRVNESGAARATVSTLNAVSTVDSTAPSKAADASLKRGTSSFPVTDAGAALSEQNDLFAKAVTLRQSGRLGEALSAYEEVIRRFPNGALAESASGEHLRLLIKTDPTRARAEARVYLARYPRGFAAREAQALLGAP